MGGGGGGGTPGTGSGRSPAGFISSSRTPPPPPPPTIQQSGHGRRRGRTLLEFFPRFSVDFSPILSLERTRIFWVTNCTRIPLAWADKGGWEREMLEEIFWEEESSQIFRQLENLKVCNEFRSQTARLCLSCKHFTWQKYGILNVLSESDFSHKPGVILK